MSEEGFELVYIQKDGKKPEENKKEAFGKKREEIVSRVKNGEDREGRILYDAYVQTLDRDPFLLGEIGVIYSGARKSAGNIDEVGEANKLRISLGTLYKAGGLGEYRPEIEIREGISSEEKVRLFKERMVKELDNMRYVIADQNMEEYYAQRARVETQKDFLVSLIEKKDFSRRKFRIISYRQEREEEKLLLGIENVALTKLNRRDLLADLLETQMDRRSFSPQEYKELSARDGGKKNKLVEKRTASLGQEIFEQRGENAGKAFENLELKKRQELVRRLLDAELEESHYLDNLSKSTETGVSETTCDLLSELKEIRLEKEIVFAELTNAVADQRVTDSIKDLSGSIAEIGRGIRKGGLRKAISRFASSYRELAFSAYGIAGEVLIKESKPIIAKFTKVKDISLDVVGKGMAQIDKLYEKSGRRVIGFANTNSNKLREKTGETYVRIMSEMERRKIQARLELAKQLHGLDVAKLQATKAIIKESSVAKERFGLAIEKAFGSVVFLTQEDISKDKKEFYDEQRRTFIKMKKDNPLLEKFDEELLAGVGMKLRVLITPPPSKKEVKDKLDRFYPLVPLRYSPKEPKLFGEKKEEENFEDKGIKEQVEKVDIAEETELSWVRPGAIFVRLKKYTNKKGAFKTVLYWTDENNFYSEEVDEDGERITYLVVRGLDKVSTAELLVTEDTKRREKKGEKIKTISTKEVFRSTEELLKEIVEARKRVEDARQAFEEAGKTFRLQESRRVGRLTNEQRRQNKERAFNKALQEFETVLVKAIRHTDTRLGDIKDGDKKGNFDEYKKFSVELKGLTSQYNEKFEEQDKEAKSKTPPKRRDEILIKMDKVLKKRSVLYEDIMEKRGFTP